MVNVSSVTISTNIPRKGLFFHLHQTLVQLIELLLTGILEAHLDRKYTSVQPGL